MPDYKKLYFSLYNHISHAIELLQQAQQKAEENYLEQEPTPLSLVKPTIPRQ